MEVEYFYVIDKLIIYWIINNLLIIMKSKELFFFDKSWEFYSLLDSNKIQSRNSIGISVLPNLRLGYLYEALAKQ